MKLNLEEVKSLGDLMKMFDDLFNVEDTKETNEIPVEETSKEKEEPCTCENKCICENKCNSEEGIAISEDVFAFDHNCFELSHKVEGFKLNEATYLEFAHMDEDNYNPGITEKQLLTVLLYRNKDNKKRYELIKKLLFE